MQLRMVPHSVRCCGGGVRVSCGVLIGSLANRSVLDGIDVLG